MLKAFRYTIYACFTAYGVLMVCLGYGWPVIGLLVFGFAVLGTAYLFSK